MKFSASRFNFEITNSPVLIGFIGERIEPICWTDFTTNKIGGCPDWINEEINKIYCNTCGRIMIFVCQLFCPIDKIFQRTIYIFLCNNVQCLSKAKIDNDLNNRIKIYRGMKSHQVKENILSQNSQFLKQELEDDWGMSGLNGEDLKNTNIIASDPQNQMDKMPLDFDFNLFENKDQKELSDWNRTLLNKSNQKSNNIFINTNKLSFISYYIESISEDDCNLDIVDEGNNNEKLYNSINMNISNNEVYEKTIPLHKDLSFHKFCKKIQKFPNQCIRYSLNGEPLIIENEINKCLMEAAKNDKTFSTCQSCGARRVFELQLMPQILNYLRLETDNKNLNTLNDEYCLDFFSVLVYTCQNNCWSDGNNYINEKAVVLPSQ
ncbi:unnamed protein product [Gordionus sp. m RMFG-2023]|uniref:programmed cell death protein 2-like n=1 Tax=Gordionus sp. m RMFG-2023 TaxID=3053472 RepID=UPI0030DE5D73